ncbi:transcriptional repressor LexA [Anaerovorax sp. IOR16]|uniref:transcriptional repressor LexA n=1 Tax=Anaerovorax sp. IOR16 TaxID=2773458 RepID=UPI0019D1C649|nr:transcriptional repressor LexA [Anaerovorax sp. IOR16]
MEQLKEREKQILSYMQNEIKTKGYPPTVREMCQFLGIKSTSTAHKDLANLEKKGYIRKDPSKPRAIEILYQNEKEDQISTDSQILNNDIASTLKQPSEHLDVSEIPVIGRIAAGTPILAEENIEDTFPLPNRYLSKGNNFMLTVHGESMIEAGIFDGDYILVKQQNVANNGDIVVAMVDGFESEATVKTFYREKDHIRLQPENHTMSPILVKDVKILGLVKGVFRYL